MNAEQWVRENNSDAPRDLLRAMSESLTDAKGASVAAQLTSSCRPLARKVAANSCGSRDDALGLLTLDALMTGAMESAGTTGASCEAAASALLSVISEAASIE